MISARALAKRWEGPGAEGAPVLADVSLEVGAGEFVAITGPSGSGKSTLLHVLGGLDRAFEGELRVAGQSLRGLDDRALSRFRNAALGFVFQSFHLVPHLDALANVALPARFAPAPVADVRERAAEALGRVGLAGKERRRPSELSGGERQRVAVARALLLRPPLLLCDEPTGNLDAASGGALRTLLQSLHGEGQTVVVVTHDAAMAAAAPRELRLEAGRLSEVRR
ncbi:MAG: hypothetical protein RL653_2847 [Pseudomonadota bacterium]